MITLTVSIGRTLYHKRDCSQNRMFQKAPIWIDGMTEDFYTTGVMEKFTNLTVEGYLNELASEKAVPGGGSVSALVAAYAMGLTQMVARIALKRKISNTPWRFFYFSHLES